MAKELKTMTEPEDGVEIEQEDDESAEIKKPFDPEKIKVRTLNVVVDQLVQRVKHDEIDLAPDFQRMAGIWDSRRKSRLIESLLLRIPIPVFYVAADKQDIWSVVDGLQRTSTINDYVTGGFPLCNLEYLAKFNGYKYANLPRQMQRRISETQLVVNVIEPGTPEEVMFNIFHRINTGGQPLYGQEIRHALHPGPVRSYLKELAETQEFLTATTGSIKKHRMADRECVLRFLAFFIDPWERYSSNDLDGYLGMAMKKINTMSNSSRSESSEAFKQAMRAASDIFGDYAFRKRYRDDDRKKPISKALFETWSIGLARRSESQLKVLTNRKRLLASSSMALLNQDHEFEVAISYATGVPTRVRKRFQAVDQLIEECLR